MNKHFSFTNKKTMLASFAAFGVTTALVAISFMPRGVNGEFSLEAIQAELAGQQTQLDNHEARITNTEKDVTALQENTNTAPVQDRVSVPQSTNTTTSPTPSPAPAQQPSVQEQPAVNPPVAPTITERWLQPCYFHGEKPPAIYFNIIIVKYSDGSQKNFAEDGVSPQPYSCVHNGVATKL